MALETKLYQKLGQHQHLVMTPQLRQAIKILQVSRAELETLVGEELAENPVLEEDVAEVPVGVDTSRPNLDEGQEGEGPSEASWDEPVVRETTGEVEPGERPGDIDWGDYLANYSNDWHGSAGDMGEGYEDRPSATDLAPGRPASLHEHLRWQLQMAGLDPREESIAAILLGNLSEDGYLQMDVEDVAFQCDEPYDLVDSVLERIRVLDPVGVGARDLRECLLLQLRASGEEGTLAWRIVADHLGLLEARRLDRLARELGAPPQEVSAAVARIATLEPKPGRDFGGSEVRYIVPDVFVHQVGDELIVTLNDDGLPRLRVSGYYRQVLNEGSSADARRYLQDKMRSASWLIKSIQQRQRTLFLVTSSIVRFQGAFFTRGVSHLRPLVLKDVAKDIGMHESTVSRATANKYVHTPQGTFELKFFFSSSLATVDGDEVSAESVKDRIREIIAREDPRSPLSDQAIADLLVGEHVGIARRTVAKYREMLGVPSSSRRRQAF